MYFFIFSQNFHFFSEFSRECFLTFFSMLADDRVFIRATLCFSLGAPRPSE